MAFDRREKVEAAMKRREARSITGKPLGLMSNKLNPNLKMPQTKKILQRLSARHATCNSNEKASDRNNMFAKV